MDRPLGVKYWPAVIARPVCSLEFFHRLNHAFAIGRNAGNDGAVVLLKRGGQKFRGAGRVSIHQSHHGQIVVLGHRAEPR